MSGRLNNPFRRELASHCGSHQNFRMMLALLPGAVTALRVGQLGKLERYWTIRMP